MVYLTVYMTTSGDVQAHQGGHPLAFVREAGDVLEILFRAVIEGHVVEYDTNNGTR